MEVKTLPLHKSGAKRESILASSTSRKVVVRGCVVCGATWEHSVE